MRRLKVLTWESHPRYLQALRCLPHDFYVVPQRQRSFDCVLFQGEAQYLDEQYELLSPAQRRLPRIYLEHQPPREHACDSRHVAGGDGVLVVHVTGYNRLMWDNGDTPVRVIEHGLADPGYRYSGMLEVGLVAAGARAPRGRGCGADLVAQARQHVPLQVGGPGEIGDYRFFFNPERCASPRLELIEAMMSGLPVVAVAAGETPMLVRNGENGFADTRMDVLVERMKGLLEDRDLAEQLGRNARRDALERFGMPRFAADWNRLLAEVTGNVRRGDRMVA